MLEQVEMAEKALEKLKVVDKEPELVKVAVKVPEKPQVKEVLAKEEVKPVKSAPPQVKVPFDAGPRSEAPVTYKQPVVTVPTPAPDQNQQRTTIASERVAPTFKFTQRGPQPMKKIEVPEAPKETRIFLKDLKQRPLPNDKFKASFLAGDPETKTFTICELLGDINDYMHFIAAGIADFVATDKQKGYKPEVDEVVLAKFEGMFYRGVCKKIESDGFLIYFLEFGNSAVVTEAEIKKLGKNLMYEVCLQECMLENFPTDITDEVTEILQAEGGVLIEGAKKNKGDNMYRARLAGL